MKLKACSVFKRGAVLLVVGLFFLLFTPNSWAGNQEIPPGIEQEEEITVTGELTVLHIDDFDRGSAKVLYHLKDSNSGKVFNLHFTGEPSGKLHTGSVITVKGKAKDQDIYLLADGSGQLQEVVASAPVVSGEQKTIVIVADFLDQSVSCPVSDIQSRVFTDPLGKSVDDLYQEMSFGLVWLTGGVTGPYVINYGSTSSCNLTSCLRLLLLPCIFSVEALIGIRNKFSCPRRGYPECIQLFEKIGLPFLRE
jgi:hypothetical protein